MRNTILIPTDFTSTPLLLLKHAIADIPAELDVVFMYSTRLSDSISDLLFYSPDRMIETVKNKEFEDGYSIITNKYSHKIKSTRFVVFHGQTSGHFKAFAQTNNIDFVVIPANYQYKKYKNEFNPIPVINKSGVPCRVIQLSGSEQVAENDLLVELLTN